MQQYLEFYNGYFVIDNRDLPIIVRASERIEHGDWKTQSVREEFMGLKDGEEVQLVKIWKNFYGRWGKVKRSDGKMADVRIYKLIYVKG